MGTRFVCSQECIAHAKYKEKILKARDRSTVVTGETISYPLRCLQNRLTRKFAEMEKNGASKEELDLFGRGRAYQGLIEGNTEDGSLLSGQIAGLLKENKPVKAIIEETVAEAKAILAQLNDL